MSNAASKPSALPLYFLVTWSAPAPGNLPGETARVIRESRHHVASKWEPGAKDDAARVADAKAEATRKADALRRDGFAPTLRAV